MLLDQLVREECGGEMLRTFRQRDFDPEFIRSRIGDEAAPFLDPALPSEKDSPASSKVTLKTRLKRILGRDARGRGEAHRWMYDGLSLRLLFTKVGFGDFRTVTYLESRIPEWDKYRLDAAKDGAGPRKPDSLFAEAAKPGEPSLRSPISPP